MMIASDSPETQNNDAVTKMQTIWWLIVIYFLKTDVLMLFLLSHASDSSCSELSRMENPRYSLTCNPLFICQSVWLCQFWPSYPNFTLTTKAHTFIHWELPTFQCDCWHQLNQPHSTKSHFDTLPVSCGSFKEWQDGVRGAFPAIWPFGLLFKNI